MRILVGCISLPVAILESIIKSPKNAEPLYNKFLEKLHIVLGDNVKTGRFGANMQIELVNDGPVTIIVENS